MIKFESPSINEIFKNKREKFIPEIGEQLKNTTYVDIEINGEKLSIDYREITIKRT
jgi:hypothetical protein